MVYVNAGDSKGQQGKVLKVDAQSVSLKSQGRRSNNGIRTYTQDTV